MPDTALVLLAAGCSERMGSPKQLLPFRGVPLLRHAAETAIAAGCDPVVVVLGSKADQLSNVLDGLKVTIAINERWTEGMGTSIHTGLRAVESGSATGVILALADQPFVAPEQLRGLVERHRESGKPIVAARYAGTVGVPAYFARSFFPRLAELAPGQGCKVVILQHLEDHLLVDCPEAAIDVDTPQDYMDALTRSLTS